jgi:hypothetical protein
VDKTHHLSSYRVHVPIWEGINSIFEPFKEWKNNQDLSWYQAYNNSKHGRREKFKEANLRNLINSLAGLLILLSSQFRDQDFSPGPTLLSTLDSYYKAEPAIGGLFRIEFPNDWKDSERYDFNWNSIRTQPDRFRKINYDLI